jgi:hypothetical protein
MLLLISMIMVGSRMMLWTSSDFGGSGGAGDNILWDDNSEIFWDDNSNIQWG